MPSLASRPEVIDRGLTGRSHHARSRPHHDSVNWTSELERILATGSTTGILRDAAESPPHRQRAPINACALRFQPAGMHHDNEP